MQLDFSVRETPCHLYRTTKLKIKQIYNTLLVDKNTRTPVVAQASSNVVRCSLAAVTVSFLQHMLDAMGVGGTFTFMGGLCVVAQCLFVLDYYKGTAWRQKAQRR